jgi:tricorn protease
MKPAFLAVLVLFSAVAAETEKPLLLQKPAVSSTEIVFSYAGDLWIVGRDGGDTRQLTVAPGTETGPYFSPDGSQIAFTGEYDGNPDVFVVPAAGGVPRRLTYHPGPDIVTGWTPDGKQIVFRSPRNSYSRFSRLYTIPVDGAGLPSEVPLPMAEEAAYSPDGARIAYVPLARAFDAWKRYRCGRTTPIWIASLADSRIEKIPRENSNDFSPIWVGDRIYFLSDRNGPVTLFSYDLKTKKVS